MQVQLEKTNNSLNRIAAMPRRRSDLRCTSDALDEHFGHKPEPDVQLYRMAEDFDKNYVPNSDTRIPESRRAFDVIAEAFPEVESVQVLAHDPLKPQEIDHPSHSNDDIICSLKRLSPFFKPIIVTRG
jgi:hypothetical protein